MLAWWRMKTRTASAIPSQTASLRPKTASQSGVAAAAASAASEEKRVSDRHREPGGAGGEPGRPGQRQRHAEEGGDALAAAEPSQIGKRWPRKAARPATIAAVSPTKRAREQHRHRALGGVEEQRGGGGALVAGPEHVGGADVARADRAQVAEAEPAGDQQAEGDRAEEIGEDEVRISVMRPPGVGRPARRRPRCRAPGPASGGGRRGCSSTSSAAWRGRARRACRGRRARDRPGRRARAGRRRGRAAARG